MAPQANPQAENVSGGRMLQTEVTEQEAHAEGPESINEMKDEGDDREYEIGDHVYSWIPYLGVPFHHQQHGIVVDKVPDSIILAFVQKQVLIAEERGSKSDFLMIREMITIEQAKKKWFKIPYGVKWLKRLFTRAGTANPANSDPLEESLSRVEFLWRNSSLLRNLSVETTDEKDISECVVVWFKTGNFYSYHGLAKLGHHGADMGSNATLAGGICTQVLASSVAPFMVPVFAVYDIATTFQSWRATHKCQKEWSRITWEWNDKYSIAKHLRNHQSASSIISMRSPPLACSRSSLE